MGGFWKGFGFFGGFWVEFFFEFLSVVSLRVLGVVFFWGFCFFEGV